MGSRRDFLKTVGRVASSALIPPTILARLTDAAAADYVLRIGGAAVEIGAKQIVSTVTYNGQFPGPLLRFKEGRSATIEIHNDTDSPEQLHWHGQMVSTDVDGAAEEGTPFVPAHGSGESYSRLVHRDFAFTIPTIELAPICIAGSTAGRSGRCTSNPRMNPAITIAKYF
jgi:FtsP/CotA-like multicopper oxidase with cupredoxin domain